MTAVMVMSCGGTETATISSSSQALTYEQFLSKVYQEPTGEFIADGDTLFEDEAALHRFYVEFIATPEESSVSSPLAVMTSGGHDVKWSATAAQNLTYCVSTKFGTAHHAKVVKAMADATAAWEATANVRYVYDATQDATCTATNAKVVFNVVPVNVNGQYLARSFFPNTARKSRNVNIDATAFTTSGLPDMTGILRHELGHTLGFRHEHTRPEAGTCFEDNNWRALTPYDSASVMHYPQCNGTGDWSLTLTDQDKQGAHLEYP
jgi:hypothetical protein